MMDQELADFFAHHTPYVQEIAVWDDIRLEVKSTLCADMPPAAFITSVRSILIHKNQVLVVRDPVSQHILPGGRVESGETLTETLHRELLEETGWTANPIRCIGVKHFHHLTSKPAEYPYPYPDFLQVIYVSQAVEFHAEAQQIDGYELESAFYDLEDAAAMILTENEHLYLNEALKVLTDGKLIQRL